jgi:hypothetical protein
MVGRTREQGVERYPNGRKKPVGSIAKRVAAKGPTLIARCRDMGWDAYERDDEGAVVFKDGSPVLDHDVLLMADDERLEYPLGRLRVMGVVSEEEHDAGVRYGKIVRAYRMAISAPRPTAQGAAIAVVPDSLDGEAVPETDMTHDEWVERAASRFQETDRALKDSGSAAYREVRVVCVEPTSSCRSIEDLRQGLKGLVKFFG